MGKRVSYFDRQFLRAEDLQVEQAYHLGRRRGLSAGVFRPGVAAGLDVVRIDADNVRVTAGLALDRLGREIVLDEDSGAIAVDPAVAVEIWLAYAEAPSDPVSYLGADEQRFTRTDETPALVPVPPGNPPPDGIRLAVVPPGGDPDMSGRPAAGPRDGTVTAASLADAAVTESALADDAVTSRVLAEADGGASGQDTAGGSGVKTDHLQDGAVTEPKLADGAVSERTLADGAVSERALADQAVSERALADRAVTEAKLADGAVSGRTIAPGAIGAAQLDAGALAQLAVPDGSVTVAKLAVDERFQGDVLVPRAGPGGPGVEIVQIDQTRPGRPAFHLVAVSLADNAARPVTWSRVVVRRNEDEFHGVRLQNENNVEVTARVVALRMALG